MSEKRLLKVLGLPNKVDVLGEAITRHKLEAVLHGHQWRNWEQAGQCFTTLLIATHYIVDFQTDQFSLRTKFAQYVSNLFFFRLAYWSRIA